MRNQKDFEAALENRSFEEIHDFYIHCKSEFANRKNLANMINNAIVVNSGILNALPPMMVSGVADGYMNTLYEKYNFYKKYAAGARECLGITKKIMRKKFFEKHPEKLNKETIVIFFNIF